MKNPQIILVTTHYPPLVGGAATYFRHLAAGLAQRGRSVIVLTTRVVGQRLHEREQNGVQIYRVIPSGETMPAAVRKVVQTVATVGWVFFFRLRSNIIIHSHGSKSVTVGSMLASRVLRIPVTYDIQDFLSRRPVISRGYQPRYIATGQPIRDHLQHHGISADRITTIASVPPDGARQQPLPTRTPATTVTFLFVGELSHEIKGTDILLEAIGLALAEEPSVRLILIGNGVDGERDRQLARTLRLHDAVTFLGVQRPEKILETMDRADCLVVSSRTEGMPRVILEAFARGLPVIATRVGGIPEVVHDTENGFLVPSGDPVALATAITRMARDPELRIRLGLAGHRWVATLPTWADLVAKIDAQYERG